MRRRLQGVDHATWRPPEPDSGPWADVGNPGPSAHAASDAVDLDFDHRDPDLDPEWIYWLDREEIDVMAARCMVALNRPTITVGLLTGVLDRSDPNRARELAYYTRSR